MFLCVDMTKYKLSGRKTAHASIPDSFLIYYVLLHSISNDLQILNHTLHPTPNDLQLLLCFLLMQVAFGRPCKTFGHQKHDGQFRQL